MHHKPQGTVLPSSSGLPSTPSSLFEACRRHVNRFLEEWLKALFYEADQELFAGARDADNDNIARDCFDAMQELHRIQSPIGKAFIANVLGGLERLWEAEITKQVVSQGKPPAVSAEQMSLIDTQSMEDEVMVATIAVRASAALRAGEHALLQRLSHILPDAVPLHENPLGAASVCTAFHEAGQNLGAQPASRHALFRALDKTLVRELGKLHKELNDLLAASGISATSRDSGRTKVADGLTTVQATRGSSRKATVPEASERRPSAPTAAATEAHLSSPAEPPASVLSWGAPVDQTLEIPFANACQSAWRLMRLDR